MFCLHLTALTSLYEKELIHKLVVNGYSVSPATEQGVIAPSSPNAAGALISLCINKSDELSAVSLYQEIVVILNDMKAKYYSLIILPFSYNACWSGGNFSVIDNSNKLGLN